MAPARSHHAAAWTARVSALSGWRSSSAASAAPIAAGDGAPAGAARAARSGRCCEVLDAADAAAGAAGDRAAAREMRRACRSPASATLTRAASPSTLDLDGADFLERSTMPSVSEKPAAKSSRSAGVPIMTANGWPPKAISTGVSTATRADKGPTGRRRSGRRGRGGDRAALASVREVAPRLRGRPPAAGDHPSHGGSEPRLRQRHHSAAVAPHAAQREGLLAVALLPVGKMVGAPHLHRRHLVFRAVGRPVGISVVTTLAPVLG